MIASNKRLLNTLDVMTEFQQAKLKVFRRSTIPQKQFIIIIIIKQCIVRPPKEAKTNKI